MTSSIGVAPNDGVEPGNRGLDLTILILLNPVIVDSIGSISFVAVTGRSVVNAIRFKFVTARLRTTVL